MNITFISPYEQIWSVGVRILAALLKQQRHRVQILFLRHDFKVRYEERILDETQDLCSDADLVGISLSSSYFHNAVQIASKLRSLHVPIAWGGVHATVRPEECAQHADIICRGEAEETILEITRRMQCDEDYTQVPGAWIRCGGDVQRNALRPPVANLDMIPFQDYEYEGHYVLHDGRLEPMSASLLGAYTDYRYMLMATRGCPFGCSYCVNSALHRLYGNSASVRRRSVLNIIDELRQVKKKLPQMREIYFDDDAFFTYSNEEMEMLCREYEAAIDLPFTVTGATPLTLTGEKLAPLVRAGLRRVRMGIQTGSEKTRRLYRRNFSNDQVLQAAREINRFRDQIDPPIYDIILDNPWEAESDLVETLMFLSHLPVPFTFNLFSLTLYPGTELYDKAKESRIILDEASEVYQKKFRECKDTFINRLFILLNGYAGSRRRLPPALMRLLTDATLRRLRISHALCWLLRARLGASLRIRRTGGKIARRAKTCLRAALRIEAGLDFTRECEFFNISPAAGRARVVTIMTCCNLWAFTRQGIASYYKSLDSRRHYILLLLDDRSTDETKEWVMEHTSFDDFGYVRFKRNRGVTRSWNYGLHLALNVLKADYVVLANNDVLLPRGAIGKLVDNLEDQDAPAIIGPLTNCPGWHRGQDVRRYVENYVPREQPEEIEATARLIADRGVFHASDLPADIPTKINGFFWAGHREAFLGNIFKKGPLHTYYFDPCMVNFRNEDEFQERIQAQGERIKIVVAANTFVFHFKDISQHRWKGRHKPEGWEFFRPTEAAGQDQANIPLPPKRLRLCGGLFHDDQYFIESGLRDVEMLIRETSLPSGARILDLGCGAGRLAIGFINAFGASSYDYTGLDVAREQLEWCSSNIGQRHPHFTFFHLDAHNERYNPSGSPITRDFALPFKNASFDLICLFSVFTHMRPDDVTAYLGEVRRCLKPGGRIFTTAFLRDARRDVVINPRGYHSSSNGPLHRVQYRRRFFARLLETAGLRLLKEHQWIQEQTGLWLACGDVAGHSQGHETASATLIGG